jgi:hypothetical protein
MYQNCPIGTIWRTTPNSGDNLTTLQLISLSAESFREVAKPDSILDPFCGSGAIPPVYLQARTLPKQWYQTANPASMALKLLINY